MKTHRLGMRNFAYQEWQDIADQGDSLPDSFVTADMMPASAHLDMQACLQPFVDNAISKTVNLAAEATREDVEAVFSDAYSSGLKGCTVFRPGARSGQVLRSRDESHCCHVDREAD